jgi:small subunit ribosomal protein S16
MLVIRMQRTGRSGHPMFRLVVQDSRRSPSRGKIVMQLGHYDPHQKTLVVNKEKAIYYLEHGAHPSDRVARLFKLEKINLPKWVQLEEKHARPVKDNTKLRRNRPADAVVEKVEVKPANATESEATSTDESIAAPEEVVPVEESAIPTPDDSTEKTKEAETEPIEKT